MTLSSRLRGGARSMRCDIAAPAHSYQQMHRRAFVEVVVLHQAVVVQQAAAEYEALLTGRNGFHVFDFLLEILQTTCVRFSAIFRVSLFACMRRFGHSLAASGSAGQIPAALHNFTYSDGIF